MPSNIIKLSETKKEGYALFFFEFFMRYIALKKFLAGWSVAIFFNIIPALFAIAIGYDRGFFVLESLPLVLLAGMGARFFAFAYGIIFAGLELIYGVSQAYPLFEATQLIDVVEFLPNANKKYILLVVVYFLVFFGIVFFGAKLARFSGKFSLSIVVLMICGFSLGEKFNNFSYESEKFFILNQTLVGGVYFSLEGSRRFNNAPQEKKEGGVPFALWEHSNVPMNVWADGVLPKKILFVMVESWGMPINQEEYIYQLKNLKNKKNIKILNEGLIKYGGGTAVAELRELCGLYPHALSFRDVPEDFAKNCLPRKLRDEGRLTVALHAASGHMYHREDWYPRIGFEKTYFFDNPIAKARKCFSFPGYCDVDLIDAVKNKIIASESIFFYWLTLNSHIPYDARDLKRRDDGVCHILGIEARDRCIHFQLLQEFFSDFAEKFDDPGVKDLHVVFVGDHSPPFLGVGIRKYFSKDDMVPFLYLRVGK